MNHAVTTNAKPGADTPGFAQSTWLLVAIPFYRIGLAGANACRSFPSVTVDGAGYCAALLWGGPLQ